jgi:hypothetical protein
MTISCSLELPARGWACGRSGSVAVLAFGPPCGGAVNMLLSRGKRRKLKANVGSIGAFNTGLDSVNLRRQARGGASERGVKGAGLGRGRRNTLNPKP